jgi:hypothetical protein
MGGMMFGTQDEIECLTNHTFAGPHGDQLCLASKISMHFFVAGVGVSDGGYVLKIKDANSFYNTTPEMLKALQEEGTLPSPLPPYHISTFQYLFGYSLWLIFAVMVVFWGLKKMFGKMEPFLRADVAPTSGPPIVRTDDDRWLTGEIGKTLEPGERLQHLAVCANAAPGTTGSGVKEVYVALTDRRLIAIDAVVGFRGRKRELGAMESWSRDAIVQVQRQELMVIFAFADDTALRWWVNPWQRKFTNQWLFARDVPKLLGAVIEARTPPVQAVNAPA